jgi:hypothetical protein
MSEYHTLLLCSGVTGTADGTADAMSGCRCGARGHALLAAAAAAADTGDGVWSGDVRCTAAVRLALRRAGLLMVMEASESAGWTRGMWGAFATAAGIAHAAAAAGTPDAHISRCGGTWSVDGVCGRCGGKRRLTDAQARRRIQAMPAGPERDAESRAGALLCPAHGRMRAGDVRTDKCCHLCREMLVRDRPVA